VGTRGICRNLRDALPGKPWHGVKWPYAQRMNDEIGTAGEPPGGSEWGQIWSGNGGSHSHVKSSQRLTSDAAG
jgi:hypothetical protein